MLIIGIILSVFGIGFFCWLLFTLAVYALPFFAGLTAGLAAFHSGSGVIGALIVGVLAGGATLAIGQIVFATVRTPLIRAAIGLLYAVPAAIAGYHATSGSPISACRPKAGARHSPLSALSLSAARPGRACLCSSRPMSGGASRRSGIVPLAAATTGG